jgi:hypothetical protein
MDLESRLQDSLGLTPALAQHLHLLLTNDVVELPRMEVYRLRRALRQFNTEVYSQYGKGYYLLPEDRQAYLNWFKVN